MRTAERCRKRTLCRCFRRPERASRRPLPVESPHMRVRVFAALSLLSMAVAPVGLAGQAGRIAFDTFSLSNGLHVIMSEDHSTPGLRSEEHPSELPSLPYLV